MEPVWADWRIGVANAVFLAAGFALMSAWITPRGPITTAEALISMALALIVGAGAGLAMGGRWSLLITPVVFAMVFEVARIGTSGPTVDGIRIDSMLGVVAFVVGRGAHGILVFMPMVVGSSLGIWMAGRLGRPATPRPSPIAWIIVGLLAACVAVVAFSVARPASTAPILGADGQPLAGSVAELVSVSIGGHDQTLMIRGRSVDSPVLLYLAGGPGGTDLGAMRADTTLEQGFVVVTWDQRGAGKSYGALDPIDTLTLDQAVDDAIEVTNYLRERFDEEKIYIVGNSWGTTLGVLAAQRHPELYHAYVGTGQMVSQRETDVMFWEDTLAWAERTGNTGLAETLHSNGPPPYDDVTRYEYATSYEHDWNPYPEFDPGTEMPAVLFVPEYTWMDRVNGFRGFFDSAAVLYPQLQDIDFRVDVPQLDVPLYMVLGEHEARGRAVLADEWFNLVEAPSKERIVFAGAGHRPQFDQPGQFAEVMSQVLAETYADTAGGN
ncbi:MAG: alpha/beta hydrolase [Acidimicrobiia bacterium]